MGNQDKDVQKKVLEFECPKEVLLTLSSVNNGFFSFKLFIQIHNDQFYPFPFQFHFALSSQFFFQTQFLL